MSTHTTNFTDSGATFAFLDGDDLSALAKKLLESQAASIRKTAAECGLTPLETFHAIRSLPDELLVGDLTRYANTVDGSQDVLLISLKKSGVDDDRARELVRTIPPTKRNLFALAVILNATPEQMQPQPEHTQTNPEATPAA